MRRPIINPVSESVSPMLSESIWDVLISYRGGPAHILSFRPPPFVIGGAPPPMPGGGP